MKEKITIKNKKGVNELCEVAANNQPQIGKEMTIYFDLRKKERFILFWQ